MRTWPKQKCECTDPGCPVHKGQSHCGHDARQTVYREDMEDRTGTRVCDACADDMFDSGLFTSEQPR